jgi:ribosomal protein S18 acetylase RimI-like enzyme
VVSVRSARWPGDAPGIAAVDTSFSTDRVYHVERSDELGFRLREDQVAEPVTKTYPVDIGDGDDVFVAIIDNTIVGYAQLTLGEWNRRAVIAHLYVAPPHRGRGAGRRLVDTLAEAARAAGARTLWLETQNVNYPAVSFYRRLGFRLCGLDETLYDPRECPGEIALFFAREL